MGVGIAYATWTTSIHQHHQPINNIINPSTQGEISDEEFRRHFEPYGIIEDSVVLRDKVDGSSRGFGFITFRDELSVEKCLVEPHYLNGRQVELKRAIEKEKMAAAASNGGGGGLMAGAAPTPARTGKVHTDWTCPECSNRNFGWREVCNRCKVCVCCFGVIALL